MKRITKIFQTYRSMPVSVKASAWYTICNIFQKGISFIIIPIYTRILTTAEYGQYTVFQSWRDILIIFATLNLYCGVFTKAMVDYKDDRDRYTSCMQGLSTIITAVLFAVYLTAVPLWNSLLESNMVTMLLLFVYFITFPAFSFWSVRQRVEYKYGRMVVITLLTSVATPAVSILLLCCSDLREEAVIWGYLIVQSSVGIIFYVLHFVRGKVFFVKKYWIHALKFNIPLIPHYLSLIVLGQADRIMIKELCGSDKAGIYNLAYQVSMVMNVIISAINGSFVPWSYEKLRDKQYTALKKASNGLCLLMSLITLGIMLVAPEFIAILGTEEYSEAVWIVPAVAISVFFTFCYNLFSTVEFYYGATKFVMVASMTGAVLNIILNAIFIPIFGYIAAGYTTAVCYLVFMIMHYIFMKLILRKQKVSESVYDVSFMTVNALILCALGVVSMLVYGHDLIRYGLIVAVLVVVVIKRNEFIKILKNMK